GCMACFWHSLREETRKARTGARLVGAEKRPEKLRCVSLCRICGTAEYRMVPIPYIPLRKEERERCYKARGQSAFSLSALNMETVKYRTRKVSQLRVRIG